jgi:hypothetical protein
MADGTRWDGKDPRLRLLRSVTAVVLLGLLVDVVLDPSRSDIPTLGTLLGALLVVLGFEVNLWRRQ